MSKENLKVCYLINQYPKISHTFVRREILALEALGAEVLRVSVRQVAETLVDTVDQQEQDKTHFIISDSKARSAWAMFTAALCQLPSLLKTLPLWYRLAKNAQGSYLKHFFYLLEACWLRRFSSIHKVQHIHAHFGTNSATVSLLCRALGGPCYSFTVHGPEEFDSPKALSIREKVHHAKFVVAITSFCKSQLYRWADFSDWPKITEVHCVVDDAMLLPASNPVVNGQRFVSIGRLCEQKGQVILLEAMAKVKKTYPEIELHLIGDGEYRDYIERYIKANQLEKNVILHGWQGTAAIVEQLDQSAALVLPSFAEGLPVVIMEAFARRRPVLTTYIAGIPELVTPDCGWLVPAGDVNALANAMEAVVAAPIDELTKKGVQGYEAVRARHSAATEALKLYQNMQATESA